MCLLSRTFVLISTIFLIERWKFLVFFFLSHCTKHPLSLSIFAILITHSDVNRLFFLLTALLCTCFFPSTLFSLKRSIVSSLSLTTYVIFSSCSTCSTHPVSQLNFFVCTVWYMFVCLTISLSFFLSFFLSCFPLSFLLYHMALLMMTTAATAETEAEAATTK